MAAIEMTVTQRLFLEALLGEQRGSVKDLIEIYDISKKIKVENRSEYLKQLPTGEVLIDTKKSSADSAQIDFEKAEVRKIKDLLDAHKGFGPSDLEWVLPLQRQLESI